MDRDCQDEEKTEGKMMNEREIAAYSSFCIPHFFILSSLSIPV
jgi:hypothetical protein